MSDSSSVELRYLEEVTWGVTPAVAMQILRFTTENFETLKNAIESDEVVSDAQVADLIAAGYSSQATLGGELSFGTYDDFISAAIRTTTFGAETTITASTLSMTATTLADSGSGLGSFVAGQFIKVTGFTQNSGENNGIYLVTTATAAALTLYPAPAATESAGDSVTAAGAVISNGTSSRSFGFEREHTDLTNIMESWPGCRIGSMDLSWDAADKVAISFGILGKKGVPATATIGTGAATAATTTQVMNSSGHLQWVGEGSTLAAIQVISASLSVATGARVQPISASEDPFGIGLGRVRVTGNVTMYFANQTHQTAFLNDSERSLAFAYYDANGKAYGVYLPRVKYSKAANPTPGNDDDVELELAFTALKDATLGKTIMVTAMA